MPSKNTSGGLYGTAAAAVGVTVVDDYNPIVMLFKQFSATGATAAVSVPSGVGQVSLQTASSGAPTGATVIAQGSADNGNSWATIPSTNTSPGSQRYTQVRLNCTSLSGGTTPTLTVAALFSP